ncbi:MAG: enoyl-CoA hydratase/isomerase family protein [Bacteroidales bacterium]|nr:enoyl-CoA hydratase/isomerase family protein [Bacteroidales bacterium]MBN2818250.1 enoyl-CoA hydratase/isomerase family protein [Bacteroidales bacterium]
MQDYKTLEYGESGKLAVLKLNRPLKLNALNEQLIDELTELFVYLTNRDEVVLLQLSGKGNAFCAGADIEWLNRLKDQSVEIIEQAFLKIADMLQQMYSLPQTIVAMAHGSVYGGGLGLLACSDFVLSAPDTKYSFSEINLGLIPATISPYVIRKIGTNNAKELFYSGERFQEEKALEIGLIDQVVAGKLNFETLIKNLLKKPQSALKATKQLFRNHFDDSFLPGIQKKNSRLIAELIKTKETQELLNKFLKR